MTNKPLDFNRDFLSFINGNAKLKKDTLITSSYMASVVVPPGNSFFDFDPTTNIIVSSSMLRATGEVSLVIA